MRAYHVGPWDPDVDNPYACHQHPASKPQVAATAVPAKLSFDLSPNPLNPSTTISFTLPQSAHVRLVVFDVRAPHMSGPNVSDRSRHAYTLHVVDRNCRYPEENWLQRSPDLPLRGFVD